LNIRYFPFGITYSGVFTGSSSITYGNEWLIGNWTEGDKNRIWLFNPNGTGKLN